MAEPSGWPSGFELRSTITRSGELRLCVAPSVLREPGEDEVVVQVEAAPINPSDINTMLGPVDLNSLRSATVHGLTVTTGSIPAARLGGVAGRLDLAQLVGNEGVGRVVNAGSEVTDLLNRRVAFKTPGAFADYRLVRAKDCLPLPEGVAATAAAGCLVNPRTALAMAHTVAAEGHGALVHTAAASSLGRMLVAVCAQDGIPLVNIVRSPAQADMLRELGAVLVCDSSQDSFDADLVSAVSATGATLAFDAIGGGRMASRILQAMETAAKRTASAGHYGSAVRKQVYIYGGLDASPTELHRRFGMAWNVGGWLMSSARAAMSATTLQAMDARILSGLDGIFASAYVDGFSLTQAIQPEAIRRFSSLRTGEKYLVCPEAGPAP